MTPERHERIKSIFFEACDAPTEQRAALLARMCGDDASLRAEVDALLKEDPGDSDGGIFAARAEAAIIGSMLDEEHVGDPVGEIAGCRVVRKVGEGGMGSVYECEQESPHRRVAIKLMQRGLGGSAGQRRFRQEAEALGRLRHPNIARIYEAGSTQVSFADGRTERAAYLMMEFVEGVPLTAYARGASSCTRDRLELMIAVCEGVRHAHAMGVVHRDLKPANILVERCPSPIPRILDFGVARVTGPDQATTLATSPGQVLGTLAYMPPEQIAGDPALVDTRSDVYALGVILFEMLADRLPLEFPGVSIAEAARIVRDVEPPSLGTLRPEYRGDLSTIVAKALQKSPEDRYQSAGELAADLARFLSHEPISARPVTRMYVLRKFARRNPALVMLGSIAAFALLVGTGVATAGLISAKQANNNLVRSNEQTLTQLRRSEQVVQLMRNMLLSVRPMVARDRDTTLMREVLERARGQLDAGQLKNMPEVEADMRATIAETYAALGDNTNALAQIELAMRPVRSDNTSADPTFQRIRQTYANILFDWNRTEEAGRELSALAGIRKNAALPEAKIDAEIMASQAAVLDRLGQSEASLELRRKSIDIRRRVQGEKHPDIATQAGNLAGTLQNLGRLDEALPLLQECLSVCEAMDPPALMHITIVRNNLAALLNQMDRPAQAEAELRPGIEIAARIYKPDHQQIGLMKYNLANSLRAQRKHAEALEEYRAAASVLEAAFGEHNVLAIDASAEIGAELTTLGRFAEAETQLLATHAKLNADDKDMKRQLASSLATLYELWDKAEPSAGHGANSSRWRER